MPSDLRAGCLQGDSPQSGGRVHEPGAVAVGPVRVPGGRLDVRLLIGSSLEDFALARAILHAAARRSNAWIRPEERPPIPVDQLETAYGERWAKEMVDWGARKLRELVREKGTITLDPVTCPQ